MATLNYKNIEYNVIFIDPSASEAGDGTTITTALNEMPTTLVNNTCYVIRQTDPTYSVYVRHQSDATLENIMFLGAKAELAEGIAGIFGSDWDKDSYEYANIRFRLSVNSATDIESRACIYSDNLSYLTFHNCYMYRKTGSSMAEGYAQDLYNWYGSPFFYTANENYKVKLDIYKCKLSTNDLDLDDDEYIEKSTGLDYVDTSRYPYSKIARMYFTFTSAECISIRESVLNGIAFYPNETFGSLTRTTSALISVAACHNFSFTDNVVNMGAYNPVPSSIRQEANCALYVCMNTSENCTACVVNNVTYNCILGETYCPLLYLAFNTTGQYCDLSFTNVDVHFKKMNMSITSAPRYPGCGLSTGDAYGIRQMLIDNLHVHGNDDFKIPQVSVLALTTRGTNIGVPTSGVIRNVTVELSDRVEGIPAQTEYLRCCCFNFNYSSKSATGGQWNDGISTYGFKNAQSYVRLDNVSIKAPYCYSYFQGVVANFGEMQGKIQLGACNSIDIEKLTATKFDVANMEISEGSNYLRVREFVGNTDFSTAQLYQKYMANAVYIDKSNMNLFTTNADTTQDSYANAQACCLNMIKDGRFFARNCNTFARSWGVSRDGSSSTAMLRFNSNVNNTYPLLIGSDPYKGFEVTPQITGKQELIAYLAHSGLTSADGPKYLQFIVRTPRVNDDGSTSYDTFYSTALDWNEDDSVWSDSDVIPMRVNIPINVQTLSKPIEVKISYNWYSADGYVYVDPDFVVEQKIIPL